MYGWPDHLEAVDKLNEDDLGDPRNRRLLPLIQSLARRGLIPTPVLVLDEMRRQGDVSYLDPTAAAYLHTAYASADWAGTGVFLLLTVLRASWRRRITQAGQRFGQYGPDASDEALHELVEREFACIRGARERLRRGGGGGGGGRSGPRAPV